MRIRRSVAGIVAMACLAVPGTVVAQERLVHHGIDRNTSAIVRVFKTSAGGRIEVETPDLKVAKDVAGSKVVTTIKGNSEQLVIAFDRKTLSVANRGERVAAALDNAPKLERARAMIAGSPVAARAAALIGRLGFGADTPIQPMLLTTRAFLLAAAGDRTAIRPQIRPAVQAAAVVRASFQDKSYTPTECWEAYAKEAIAAWMEYEDCMKDVRWFEFLDAAACATIYDMRAIGAFSWWLRCVSLG